MTGTGDVVYYSSTRSTPNRVGFVQLGGGKILRLSGNFFYVYTLYADKGKVKCRNVIKRPLDWFSNPAGGLYDGNTVKMLEWMMGDHPQGEIEQAIPLLYASTVSEDVPRVDDGDSELQDRLCECIGDTVPEDRAIVASSPGGTVEQVMVTESNILISFIEPNNVVELPRCAKLYGHIVRTGFHVEEGVPIADIVPRQRYSWESYLKLPTVARRLVEKNFLQAMSWRVNERGRNEDPDRVIAPLKLLGSNVIGSRPMYEYGVPRKPTKLKNLVYKDQFYDLDLSQDSFKKM
jgi:hypothetical protein